MKVFSVVPLCRSPVYTQVLPKYGFHRGWVPSGCYGGVGSGRSGKGLAVGHGGSAVKLSVELDDVYPVHCCNAALQAG